MLELSTVQCLEMLIYLASYRGVLVNEPRTSAMQNAHSTTKLNAQIFLLFLALS